MRPRRAPISNFASSLVTLMDGGLQAAVVCCSIMPRALELKEWMQLAAAAEVAAVEVRRQK